MASRSGDPAGVVWTRRIPAFRATSSAYADSSTPSAGNRAWNPRRGACSCAELCSAASSSETVITIDEESSPPDRQVPMGTSERSRSRTDESNVARNSSTSSSSRRASTPAAAGRQSSASGGASQ